MKKESGGNPEFKRWLALYFIEKGNWRVTDKAIEEFGTDDTPKQTMEFAEVCSDREREERSRYRVGLTAKEKKKIAHTKVADMIDDRKAEELLDSGYITYSANWKDRIDRITIVRNFVRIIGKDPRDLKKEDFHYNRLGGLLHNYYNNSPYEAVKEAFPERNSKPWEMAQTPHGFYEEKENRIAAVKWLVEKLKKDPRDLTQCDFSSNRLVGLLTDHYNNSPYEAVKEAYPELNIKPWEMIQTPHGFYEKKENRIAAVKWLVDKLNKDPRDLTQKDFHKNRLRGVLPYYNDSPYEAVKEAGLVSEADEGCMRSKVNLKYRSIPSSKEVLEAAKKLARNAEKKLPKRMVKGRRTPRTG
jgi:predicted FMN-binding regulatory protein PaiB